MPRYRKLPVKTVESLDINDMPNDFTRLFWLLLQLAVCREGRGLDNSAWLKAKTLPLRADVNLSMIEDAMSWFANRGMVERYEADGRHYFRLVNWFRYQGNTSKEAESQYPPPSNEIQHPISETARVTPDSLLTSSALDADSTANADTDANIDAAGHTLSTPGLSNVRSPSNENLLDEMIGYWGELFPEKAQPKLSTYRKQVAARSKEPDFRENWRKAMFEASQSPHLQRQSWFQFEFFVRDDQNWRKCLDHFYKSFDEELRRRAKTASEPAGFDAIRLKLKELNDGQ